MATDIEFDKAWEDLESFQLTVETASVTSMSPAARKQVLDEWAAKGKIDMPQYKSLSGNPDLEHQVDLMDAAADHVEYMINEMLNDRPQVPDPHDNLELCMRLFTDTYLHLRCMKAESGQSKKFDRILQHFRNALQATKNRLQPPVTEQTGGLPGPGMTPQEPVMDPMTGQPVDPAMMDPAMMQAAQPPPALGAPPPGMSYAVAQSLV